MSEGFADFVKRGRFYLCGNLFCNPWRLCSRCAAIPREVAAADQTRAAIEDFVAWQYRRYGGQPTGTRKGPPSK